MNSKKSKETILIIIGVIIYLIILRWIYPLKDNSLLNNAIYFSFGTYGFYCWIKYVREFDPSQMINKTFLIAASSTFLAFKLMDTIGILI